MNMTYPLIILELIITVAISFALYKLLNRVIVRLREKDILTTQTSFVFQMLLKWAVVILAVLVILQILGIDTSHVLAALSAILVLVAVGFVAVWSVISNILCSFLLLLMPPFRLGDEIEIRDPGSETGVKGRVSGLNLFFTTLRQGGETADDIMLIRVPNSMFFQRVIICHAGKDTQALKLHTDTTDRPPDSID